MASFASRPSRAHPRRNTWVRLDFLDHTNRRLGPDVLPDSLPQCRVIVVLRAAFGAVRHERVACWPLRIVAADTGAAGSCERCSSAPTVVVASSIRDC